MFIERSEPPVMARSMSRSCSALTATCRAARELAQAASVVKFGPRRSKALAMRPAMTFASSPGMESSSISGRPSL